MDLSAGKAPLTNAWSGQTNPRIRVLILQPAETLDDLIQCSLEECDLCSQADYTALSYSWATQDGDASASRVIELDDEIHPVTENLYHVLLRLRSRTHARRLWVDAVCINQADEEDKTRQVALMGQIYGLAQSVVAWLGEGESEHEDGAAFAAMQCIIADKKIAPPWSPQRQELRLKHTWLPPPRTNMTVEQCSLCVAWDAAHADCSARYGGTSDRIPELRRAFMTLLRRRYFKRRWIVQEINVPAADAVVFMWGGHTLSRSDFTSGQDVPSVQIPSDVFQLRNVLTSPNGNSLIEFVARVHTTECSDPRDRIYALLSLAKDDRMKADYTRPTAEVYTSFAKLLVEDNMIPDLLQKSSKAGVKPDNPIVGLPSWVPDLRSGFAHLSPNPGPSPSAFARGNVLYLTQYRLGVLGEPTQDEKDYLVPVLDDVNATGALLGNLKVYRHGGRIAPQKGDVCCSLEVPKQYMAGDEMRAGASGLLFRPVTPETWQILYFFDFQYIHHEFRPCGSMTFAVV